MRTTTNRRDWRAIRTVTALALAVLTVGVWLGSAGAATPTSTYAVSCSGGSSGSFTTTTQWSHVHGLDVVDIRWYDAADNYLLGHTVFKHSASGSISDLTGSGGTSPITHVIVKWWSGDEVTLIHEEDAACTA